MGRQTVHLLPLTHVPEPQTLVLPPGYHQSAVLREHACPYHVAVSLQTGHELEPLQIPYFEHLVVPVGKQQVLLVVAVDAPDTCVVHHGADVLPLRVHPVLYHPNRLVFSASDHPVVLPQEQHVVQLGRGRGRGGMELIFVGPHVSPEVIDESHPGLVNTSELFHVLIESQAIDSVTRPLERPDQTRVSAALHFSCQGH